MTTRAAAQKKRAIAEAVSSDDDASGKDADLVLSSDESGPVLLAKSKRPLVQSKLRSNRAAKSGAAPKPPMRKNTHIITTDDEVEEVRKDKKPAPAVAITKRRRSVITREDDEEDESKSAEVSAESSSDEEGASRSSGERESSDGGDDVESDNTSEDSAMPRKKGKGKHNNQKKPPIGADIAPLGVRASAMRKEEEEPDAITKEREIRRAMAVYVDGSLPPEFFHVQRNVQYCVECLKDDSPSNLYTCSRCGGRVHSECLQHSQGRRRTCRDCYRWPHEIDKVLTWRDPPTTPQSRSDDEEGLLRQYYVKFQHRPHLENTWISGRWLLRISWQRYVHLKRTMPSAQPVEVVVDVDWLKIDRLIAVRKTSEGERYLVKWMSLGYENTTWCDRKQIEKMPDFATALERRQKILSSSRKPASVEREFVKLEGAPPFLSAEKKLYDYQLEGLNWMLYSWSKSTNIVLADEMGLGKTAQTVAFIAALYTLGRRPVVVLAPLSTLTHWEREFRAWAPQLNVVQFTGVPEARDVIRDYELFGERGGREPIVDVVLTSFEIGLTEANPLRRISWALMVVDEGQRLKNRQSKLFSALKDFRTEQRLLLSGTPLQNNMQELFNMLEFLQQPQFKGKERTQIVEEFEDLRQQDLVARLHEILRPHFLRRLKKDVLQLLPPKAEIVVPLSLSPLQQEYYKAILTKKLSFLRSVSKSSLLNVAMELRKCVNHPYLCMPSIPKSIPGPEQAESRTNIITRLIAASSKLSFLHDMLPKLKARGHRVLIFSQFTMLLDILEDYLKTQPYSYSRIDGMVAAADRQPIIDEFNAPGSPLFLMLLSTRACRLGINLATADTVILYDSDWNPHNDIQAFSRVHRIGQSNKVVVYRFIVMQTVEEGIIRTARRKLVLDHVVVQRMNTELRAGEIDDIIKIGTKELFEGVTPVITYDDAAMEKLLDRSNIRDEPKAADAPVERTIGGDKYLGNLSNARVWEQELPGAGSGLKTKDPDYWTKLLAARVKDAEGQQEPLSKLRSRRKSMELKEVEVDDIYEGDEGEANEGDEKKGGDDNSKEKQKVDGKPPKKARKEESESEEWDAAASGSSISEDDEYNSESSCSQAPPQSQSAILAAAAVASVNAAGAAGALAAASTAVAVPPIAVAPISAAPAIAAAIAAPPPSQQPNIPQADSIAAARSSVPSANPAPLQPLQAAMPRDWVMPQRGREIAPIPSAAPAAAGTPTHVAVTPAGAPVAASLAGSVAVPPLSVAPNFAAYVTPPYGVPLSDASNFIRTPELVSTPILPPEEQSRPPRSPRVPLEIQLYPVAPQQQPSWRPYTSGCNLQVNTPAVASLSAVPKPAAPSPAVATVAKQPAPVAKPTAAAATVAKPAPAAAAVASVAKPAAAKPADALPPPELPTLAVATQYYNSMRQRYKKHEMITNLQKAAITSAPAAAKPAQVTSPARPAQRASVNAPVQVRSPAVAAPPAVTPTFVPSPAPVPPPLGQKPNVVLNFGNVSK